jgi:hypothetical protein
MAAHVGDVHGVKLLLQRVVIDSVADSQQLMMPVLQQKHSGSPSITDVGVPTATNTYQDHIRNEKRR